MREVWILKFEVVHGKSIKTKDIKGKFIMYGLDCIESRDGNINFSIGIVELPDGTVRAVPVEMLLFVPEGLAEKGGERG